MPAHDAATAPALLPSTWGALLIPFDTPTGDGREIAAPVGELKHRPLPIPLTWAFGGVDPDVPDEVGHATIVGTLETLEIAADPKGRLCLWGTGTLDLTVPGFADLVAAAWRLRNYHGALPLGVELDDMTYADEFDDDDGDGPGGLMRITDFRISGIAINTGSAWPDVRMILHTPKGWAPTRTPPPEPHPEA